MLMGRYELFQQAYFVNDLDEAIERWSTSFGAGPFVVTNHHQCDKFMYRDTPQESDVSYAFGYLGDIQVQLIQQHDDTPSIYRDMYGADEEGFHHVATLVHDFASARQHFLDLGFELACELFTGGVDAAYFDTRSATGGFTEIHADPPYILDTFARWRAAHANHSPDADPVLDPSIGASRTPA